MAENRTTIPCCGEERTGVFCPTCGRPLRSGPLIDVLVYCRGILRQQQRNAEKQAAEVQQRPTQANRAKQKRYERAAAIWQKRCQALAEVIDEHGGGR